MQLPFADDFLAKNQLLQIARIELLAMRQWCWRVTGVEKVWKQQAMMLERQQKIKCCAV
jgi:hypothetical protein